MLLKLKKTPRNGQKDMVCNNRYGTVVFSSVGAQVEVSDTTGHQILADWPGCFEIVQPSVKVVKAKDVPTVDEAAALEATKMVSGYKNKSQE